MLPEVPAIESIRLVHLVAICGTAMGSLACMLADRGFRVTGSDTDAYPPMSDQLRAAGIEVQKGFAPEHVLADRPDLVVIGNAVRRDNSEARAAIVAGDLERAGILVEALQATRSSTEVTEVSDELTIAVAEDDPWEIRQSPSTPRSMAPPVLSGSSVP